MGRGGGGEGGRGGGAQSGLRVCSPGKISEWVKNVIFFLGFTPLLWQISTWPSHIVVPFEDIQTHLVSWESSSTIPTRCLPTQGFQTKNNIYM